LAVIVALAVDNWHVIVRLADLKRHALNLA